MDNPKVTVCLPTFNKVRYLPAAIESVLTQEFRDFELLIVDDASTDGTSNAVLSFRDSRIRYIRNPQNRGLVGNWNYCLELAQGDYAIVFHDDDVMLPGLLRREVEVLESNSRVVLVHAAAQSIDAEGAVSCVSAPHSWPAFTGGLEFVARYWALNGGGYVVMPSAMFRKSFALKLGAFNPDLKYSADADLWQRLAFAGEVGFLDEILISNRVHASQTTQKILTNSLQMLEERLKLADATRRLVSAHGGNLDRKISGLLTWELSFDLLELRRWNASIPHVFRYGAAAARAHPQVLSNFRFMSYFVLMILPPWLIRWLKKLHTQRLSSAWSAARAANK
jgi:glycosyltransferase involved in cell wall biosynthesis